MPELWRRARFPHRLPVAPLAARVIELVDRCCVEADKRGSPQTKALLADLGVHESRFGEWRSGRAQNVSFTLADRVLTAAGWDWADVWSRESCPALFDALDAIEALGEEEPDAWCPACEAWVASVRGRCMWHPVPVRVESVALVNERLRRLGIDLEVAA